MRTIESKEMKSRKGRPKINLYDTIKKDLERVNLEFKTVKEEANDPKRW